MGLVKYALSGLFPRFEPDVGDVRTAVDMVDDINHLYKEHYFFRLYWWYVTPKNRYNRKEVKKLKRLFRANGVLLIPHHRKCGDWVLRALDMNQIFLYDVRKGCRDQSCIDEIEDRRKQEIAEREKRFEGMRKIFGHNR